VVYTEKGTESLGTKASCKIAEVSIALKKGETITAFVNISSAALIDVTGMQNITGEYVSDNCTTHYFGRRRTIKYLQSILIQSFRNATKTKRKVIATFS